MTPAIDRSNRQLASETTKALVGRAESFALGAQGVWILLTSRVDAVTPTGTYVLYAVAGLHLVGALVAYVRGGPFLRSGMWLVFWIGLAFIMPLLMARLVLPRDYGASPACVPLCGYPIPQIALLAFYPWLIFQTAYYLRPAVDLLLLAGIVLEPLVIIVATHDYLTTDNWTSWSTTGTYYVLAYLFGLAMGRMCRAAVEAQLKARVAAHMEIYDDLHDEIEKTLLLAGEHQREGRHSQALDAIVGLLKYAELKRLGLMEQERTASIAALIEPRVRPYDGIFRELRVHGLGPLTADQRVGKLVSHGLGALLKNAQIHSGAQRVEVTPRIDRGFLIIEVQDDGRGFSAQQLEDPLNNLYRLRERARDLDGDLLKIDGDSGTRIQLWLPIHPLD